MNLYTVASGIQSHNEWLGVIGTNISNSGSIGYQKSTFHFADYIYNNSPIGDIGLGAGVSTIGRDTHNGALIQSTSLTHAAISGDGYFKVQDANGVPYYTRAGVFGFNAQGVYSDPSGNAVIGFPIHNGSTSQSESIITLPSSTIAPEATTKISTQFNLGITQEASPISLFESWNNGIQQNQYGQKMSFSVYTASGKKQSVDVYFDLVEQAGEQKVYEYIVSIPPEDDTRTLPDNTTKKGLLMTGAMVFSSGGSLQTMSALIPSGNVEDISKWTNAPLTTEGFPAVTLPIASGSQSVALDFGISSGSRKYSPSGSTDPLLASLLGEPIIQKYASTAYTGNTTTQFINIDGSPEGILQNVFLTQNGILTARYSNGRSLDIAQLNLYTFQATDAIQYAGNSLYTYNASIGGEIYNNKPGEGRSGIIQGGYLEQSNVDLSAEFVNMILCQNSLTANTKMFSTMDTMLQTAITLKE